MKRVTIEIDVDGQDAAAAAFRAWALLAGRHAMLPVCQVTDPETGNTETIDLQEQIEEHHSHHRDDPRYVRAAAVKYDDEGTLEVDDNAPVSFFDSTDDQPEGAYVQAWVWVTREEMEAA